MAGSRAKKGWCVRSPVHPRTAQVAERIYGSSWRAQLESFGIDALERELPRNPSLFERSAPSVDGFRWFQKEAFSGVDQRCCGSHRVDGIADHGVARLCAQPAELDSVVTALEEAYAGMDFSVPLYGDGQAAKHIAQTLRTWLNGKSLTAGAPTPRHPYVAYIVFDVVLPSLSVVHIRSNGSNKGVSPCGGTRMQTWAAWIPSSGLLEEMPWNVIGTRGRMRKAPAYRVREFPWRSRVADARVDADWWSWVF